MQTYDILIHNGMILTLDPRLTLIENGFIAVNAFLINWALTNLKIGQVKIGEMVTSWLWLPFLLFCLQVPMIRRHC